MTQNIALHEYTYLAHTFDFVVPYACYSYNFFIITKNRKFLFGESPGVDFYSRLFRAINKEIVRCNVYYQYSFTLTQKSSHLRQSWNLKDGVGEDKNKRNARQNKQTKQNIQTKNKKLKKITNKQKTRLRCMNSRSHLGFYR